MTDDEQFNATILIANSAGEIKGCGFIIDEAHAMTCRHVVDFVLASEPAGAAPAVWGGRLGAPMFRLVPEANGPDLADPDVCVLRLAESDRFPHGFTPVQWEQCTPGLEFFGTGVIQYTPGEDKDAADPGEVKGGIRGVPLDGKVVSRTLVPTRFFINAEDDDTRVEPGCSGAAVFNAGGSRGLIGMVVRYQQTKSGQIIGAQTLRDCFTTLRQSRDARHPFVAMAPEAAAGGIMLEDLEEKLLLCDRQPQVMAFFDSVLPLKARRKGVLLTTIYGDPLDLPDRLGQRLGKMGPGEFVRAPHGDAGKAPSERREQAKPPPKRFVNLASCVAADPARLRTLLSYCLYDVLKPEKLDVKFFAKAINRLGAPLTIEVQVTEEYAAAHGAMAARVWTELAGDIAARGLVYPLFVFFIVTKAGGGDAMRGWRVEDNASFVVLDELTPVTRSDVELWAKNEYGETTAEAILALVDGRAGREGAPIRLKQLENWLTGN